MISGFGYSAAKVMLVTDGASDTDISEGRAITGYTGDLLRSFCKAHNLPFEEFWRTALVKDRVNLADWRANLPLITPIFTNLLTEEIRQISPNVIVPLGELSFRWLTGLEGITKFRGSVLPIREEITQGKPTRVIPILGPNPYLNVDYSMRFISRLDFGKVKMHMNLVGPIQEIGNCWVAKNANVLRVFLERSLPKAEFLVFDIETYQNIPTCISFCFDGNESVCVPFLDKTISLDDRVLMVDYVARVLAHKIPKVNQNIAFDWKNLERYGFCVENVAGDTALAASVLYPEFDKNLGFLTSIYTAMPYFKDEGKEFDPALHHRERFYLYNAKDSLACHQIYQQQKTELVELGVEKVYNQLIRLLPIYKKMEERGIRIDRTRVNKLLGVYESAYAMYLYKLHRLVGEEINPLSSKQCTKLIFEDLGFKKMRGVHGTDEESLEVLAWTGSYNSVRDGNEILKTIIGCRKLHKVIEYLETHVHPDGRMRSNFNLGGTVSGRTSGGKTTDYFFVRDGKNIKRISLGRSFQTISKHGFKLDGKMYGKDLRSIFVPSPGYAFVECDLSQAEARVDAVLARDYDILQVFDGPVGIHRLTGSWVYGCKPEDIKKGTLEYHEAKTVRHAGERNMKEDRLMMMVHRPLSECRQILKKFHDNQPNIRDVFHRDIRETLRNKSCLIAPNGRRRDFFGRFDEHQVNEAISQLPQAIVTDYLKAAIGPSLEEAPWVHPLVEAHDGFTTEVPISRELEWAKIFKKNVEVPIDFRTCSLAREFELIIPMEAESSTETWQDLKPLKGF